MLFESVGGRPVLNFPSSFNLISCWAARDKALPHCTLRDSLHLLGKTRWRNYPSLTVCLRGFCSYADISAWPKSSLLPSESLHDSMDIFVLFLCITTKHWMWFCYSMLSAPPSFKEETNAIEESVTTLQAGEISVQGYLPTKFSEWQWIDVFE